MSIYLVFNAVLPPFLARYNFLKKERSVTARKKQSLATIVGTNISRRRRNLGLTQAELAEKLNIGGDSLSRVENGLVAPRFQRLEDIAALLECSVADLFRQADDQLETKLGPVEDLLRPLPPEIQDDAVRLLIGLAELIKKHHDGH